MRARLAENPGYYYLVRYMPHRIFFEATGMDELVEQMVDWSEQTRRNGLLSLEAKIVDREAITPISLLSKSGINLIIDGTDPELVRNIIERQIRSYERKLDYAWRAWRNLLLLQYGSSFTYKKDLGEFLESYLIPGRDENEAIRNTIDDYLQNDAPPDAFKYHALTGPNLKLAAFAERDSEPSLAEMLDEQYVSYKELFMSTLDIVAEGCLSIQSGDNPRIVRDKLEPIRSRDFKRDRSEYSKYAGSLSEEEIDALLNMGGSGEYPRTSLSDEVEQALEALTEPDLRQLLFHTYDYELARAVLLTSNVLKKRILSARTSRTAELFIDELRDLGELPVAEAEKYQAHLLNVIKRLREREEIL